MTQATPNPYEVLGVARDATPEDIKQAWRRKSAEHHPDRGGDAAAMQAVNSAWEVLGDPQRRRQYDETGSQAQDDTEARAQGLLAELFQRAMASTDETMDPLKWVFFQLQDKDAEAKQEIRKAGDVIAKLQRRRKTVRRKSEGKPNLMHALIDARIAAIRKTIPQNEQVLAVTQAALAGLADYEYIEPEDAGARSPGVADAMLALAGVANMGWRTRP